MADLSMASDDPLAEMASKEAQLKSAANNLIADHETEKKQDVYRQRIAASPVPVQPNTQFKDTVADVAHRTAQAGEGVYSGVVHGVAEMANAVAGVAEWRVNQMVSDAQQVRNDKFLDNVRQSIRAGADAITPKIDTVSGDLTEGVSQFLTAFATLPELKLAGAAKVAFNLAKAGTAQAAAFNPNNERLSNLIQSVPSLRNPVTEFIASKPGDTEAEGRIKNFLEGAGLTGVLDGALGAAGQAKSLSQSFIDTLKGYRAANATADTMKAADAVKPTAVESVAPVESTPDAGYTIKKIPSSQLSQDLHPKDNASLPDNAVSHVAVDAEGKQIAHVTMYPNGTVDRLIRMDTLPEHQGKGIATDLVKSAMDEAHANGKGYASDTQMSTGAQKVHDKIAGMEKNGEADVGTDATDGDVKTSANGRPLYESPVPAKPVEPAPYEPPGIKDESMVTPKDAASPVSTPEKPVFDPAALARRNIKISEGQAGEFAKALSEGRFSDLPAMLDDTHRTIPWDSLSDGANLQGLFNAFEGTFGQMTKSAHGVASVPDSVVQQLAKDIGGDVQNLAGLFNDTQKNGGLAARIIAGYNMMNASAREVIDRARFAKSLDIRDKSIEQIAAHQDAILSLQKQLEMHGAIVGQVRQSSAEIGRALSAHARLKASSEVALSNIGELQGTVLGPKAISKFLDKIGGVEDLESLNKAVDNLRQKGFMGVIKEMAQGGMLSGITTQVANIAGNVANAILKVGERYIAGGIGSIRGVMMPTAEHADLRSAMAYSTGAVSGLRDAFPLFIKAATGFDTGVFKQAREFQMGVKDSLKASFVGEPDVSATGRPIAKAISMSTDGLSGAELKGAQVLNITGQVVRYPGRFMGAIDNLNMGIGYQAELHARSSIMAVNEADVKGLTDDARDAFIDKRTAELRANPTEEMTKLSQEAGLYQSFQESPRTRFGEPITDMMNSHPLVKLIVAPFVHRPLNMLRQSMMDYTAAGLLSKSQRALLSAGNSDTDLALARMAIGTSAMVYAYHLASSGTIVGARMGPHDTEALDGISPYSVKIGDQWHRYDRVDPVGMWMAIGSEFHEQVQRLYDKNQENPDLATLARIGTQVMGMSAMDKSFMQSIDKLMQAVGEKNGEKATTLFQQAMSSNVAKFVPFSGALRTAAQEQDPTMRATGGDGFMQIWDTVKAGLPGLSKDLPPRRDVLGRPLTRPENAWWNPFAGQTAASDTMDKELAKVAVAVKVPSRSIDGVTLDAHQYDELMRRATQTPLFDDKNLMDYMKDLTSSDEWHQFDNTDDQGQSYKTQIVQKAIDAAYNFGKQDFMNAPANQGFAQKHMDKVMAEAKHFEPLT